MRPLGTFKSILSNGYHGNDYPYKNFDFSFGYVSSSSMTVQCFITLKWQEKKLSMIKTFKFFVADHFKTGDVGRGPTPVGPILRSSCLLLVVFFFQIFVRSIVPQLSKY